ncbi:MAG: hypothetical protein BYD32DRAFT_422497 [Podila humilis]|nr:MAG: hypothetical protein BYD32DRAFT_422497 [Podila humilis]
MDTLFNYLSTKSKWEETWGTDDMDRVDEPCGGGSGVEQGMEQNERKRAAASDAQNQNPDTKKKKEMLRCRRRWIEGEQRDLASLDGRWDSWTGSTGSTGPFACKEYLRLQGEKRATLNRG